MDTKSITGIVLAGGRSRRMGEDKSLMKLKGKTLTEYAIDTLKPLCHQVIISSNSQGYEFTGCETWTDQWSVRAPLVGICSCLKRSATDINIVLSCDMPLMNSELLHYLLDNSGNHAITVPVHGNNFIEPLCGIYKKSALQILEKFIDRGNFRLHECIQAAAGKLVWIGPPLPFYSEDLFSNLNTPEDYRNIQF